MSTIYKLISPNLGKGLANRGVFKIQICNHKFYLILEKNNNLLLFIYDMRFKISNSIFNINF